MTKKKLRFGAIPKLNMPRKSHETAKPEPRPERSVVRNIEEPSVKVCYKTMREFCQRLSQLKSLHNWNIRTFTDRVVLQQMVEPFLLPKFEIAVDDSLGFTVKVYGCFLPEDHPVYMDCRRTVRNITISRLVKDLEDNYSVCCGVDVQEFTGKLFHHVVPTSEEADEEEQFPHKGYWRAKGCLIVC